MALKHLNIDSMSTQYCLPLKSEFYVVEPVPWFLVVSAFVNAMNCGITPMRRLLMVYRLYIEHWQAICEVLEMVLKLFGIPCLVVVPWFFGNCSRSFSLCCLYSTLAMEILASKKKRKKQYVMYCTVVGINLIHLGEHYLDDARFRTGPNIIFIRIHHVGRDLASWSKSDVQPVKRRITVSTLRTVIDMCWILPVTRELAPSCNPKVPSK